MEILRRYQGQRTFTDSQGREASSRYKRVSKETPCSEIKTDKQTTLDILSMLYYGTPLLYWLIADFNDILDPMVDIPAGTSIKIPVIE